MKPSIDQQIEAVDHILSEISLPPEVTRDLEAALKTLEWVKRHAPLIKTVLEEFPGAKVQPREETE